MFFYLIFIKTKGGDSMKKLFLVVFLCSAFLLMANTASAIPVLQLDIVGGTYDGNTTVTSSGSFQLVALINPFSGLYDGSIDNYYISAALVPKQDYSGSLSPSITGSNLTGNVLSDYGDPGLEHGIFDTYYWEYELQFTPYKVESYDVAEVSGTHTLPTSWDGSGKYLFAAILDVDVSSLLADSNIDAVHFDLYAKDGLVASNNIKAPFSHDASTVPEPTTMLLFGAGLVGLAGFGRKKFKK
jgi:hypothetical protein